MPKKFSDVVAALSPLAQERLTVASKRLIERFDEVEQSFIYHPPVGNQQERYEEIREAAKHLAHLFLAYVPETRWQSIAITELEIAVAMANKGIACGEATPVPEATQTP